MTPQKQAARAEHKQRMAERRERQNARQPATVVMTRAEYQRLVVDRRPAVQIIFATRYMPHQGKRECERRVQRMVGWDFTMLEAA